MYECARSYSGARRLRQRQRTDLRRRELPAGETRVPLHMATVANHTRTGATQWPMRCHVRTGNSTGFSLATGHRLGLTDDRHRDIDHPIPVIDATRTFARHRNPVIDGRVTVIAAHLLAHR